MRNEIEISVIIPVYNVESYLEECLDSIISQTFENIEILCINDGSTDNSYNILKDYAKKDNRIKIFNQENKGQGFSRNKAINLAKGKYTYFMDSDDILKNSALEEIYKESEENNLDMLIFKLIEFKDDDKNNLFESEYYEMRALYEIVQDNIFDYTNVKDKLLEVCVSPPGKLFKTDLIKTIRFPENLIFEDNVFFIKAILDAKRVKFYNKHLYYRRLRDSSTIKNYSRFSDAIEISNMVFDIFKEKNLFDEFSFALYTRKLLKLYHRYYNVKDDDLRDEFFELLQKDFISHQQEYEDDSVFTTISEKINHFFYWVIEAENRYDFEIKMENYNLKGRNRRLVAKNRELLSQIQKLNRGYEKGKLINKKLVKDIKKKNDENILLKKENRKILKEKNEKIQENEKILNEKNELLQENEKIKSTYTYKIWEKYDNLKRK